MSTHPAMALLGRGVPLSLLLDLVLGPHSRELLEQERAVPAPRDGQARIDTSAVSTSCSLSASYGLDSTSEAPAS